MPNPPTCPSCIELGNLADTYLLNWEEERRRFNKALDICQELVNWYRNGGRMTEGVYYTLPDTDGFRDAGMLLLKYRPEEKEASQ